MKKNRGKMVPLVGKYLSLQLNSGGYPVVRPSLEGKLRTIAAHRLIAMAFLPNPNNYKCVNHKNGIKTDNRVENLEWCTHSQNTQHAFDTGLSKPHRGTSNGNSKLKPDDIRLIRSLARTGTPKNLIALKFDIERYYVHRIINKQNWAHVA